MQAEAASLLGAERSSVVAALKSAAAATGSDFHYLLGTAMRESSLKPNAQSSSSSAAGLFQFIDQTWLSLVKEHGGEHGLSDYAAAITKDGDGHYHADPALKQAILALRKDPQLSALMAGEYAKSTQGMMRANLGREVCGGELYAAHFLGPDAACKLIRLAGSEPATSAAAQFPQAAAANKNVFFRGDGAPKSVREVYDWAMRQPGGADTVRSAQSLTDPSLTPQGARASIALAQDAEVQMLLSSVANWQPGNGHSLFGNFLGLGTDATPSSAMSFSPSLLGLLSDARNDDQT
jgi:Transglycosylase SLT domain